MGASIRELPSVFAALLVMLLAIARSNGTPERAGPPGEPSRHRRPRSGRGGGQLIVWFLATLNDPAGLPTIVRASLVR